MHKLYYSTFEKVMNANAFFVLGVCGVSVCVIATMAYCVMEPGNSTTVGVNFLNSQWNWSSLVPNVNYNELHTRTHMHIQAQTRGPTCKVQIKIANIRNDLWSYIYLIVFTRIVVLIHSIVEILPLLSIPVKMQNSVRITLCRRQPALH